MSACILHAGSRNSNGYGLVYEHGRCILAHRKAWQDANGVEIQPGQVVRHSCDNPPCVNPDHLSIGTQADNMRDMWARGRATTARAYGEAAGNAKITVELAAAILRDPRSSYAVAAALGINRNTTRDIKSGRTWAKAIAEFEASGAAHANSFTSQVHT